MGSLLRRDGSLWPRLHKVAEVPSLLHDRVVGERRKMPGVYFAETPLEMARRHVARGELLVAEQETLIERLRADGHPTGEAEDLLVELRRAQALHLQHFALEETKASAGR